jgi:hypothetical protein
MLQGNHASGNADEVFDGRLLWLSETQAGKANDRQKGEKTTHDEPPRILGSKRIIGDGFMCKGKKVGVWPPPNRTLTAETRKVTTEDTEEH